MPIYDAGDALCRQRPCRSVIFAARNTAPASSRDWAAKGTGCSACAAVIAESFERIHRSNLVGWGVFRWSWSRAPTGRQPRQRGDEQVSILGIATCKPRQIATESAMRTGASLP
jgi:aconitate hydratase